MARLLVTLDEKYIRCIDSRALDEGISRSKCAGDILIHYFENVIPDVSDGVSPAYHPDTETMQQRIDELHGQVEYLKHQVSQWQGVAASFQALIPTLPTTRPGLLSRLRGFLGSSDEQP